MSISFTADEFARHVISLGPDFFLYGAALGETNLADSAFLHNLTDQEAGILFAFMPQAHQIKLESLFSQNTNAGLVCSASAGVELW
jgi:hypothetical protein